MEPKYETLATSFIQVICGWAGYPNSLAVREAHQIILLLACFETAKWVWRSCALFTNVLNSLKRRRSLSHHGSERKVPCTCPRAAFFWKRSSIVRLSFRHQPLLVLPPCKIKQIFLTSATGVMGSSWDEANLLISPLLGDKATLLAEAFLALSRFPFYFSRRPALFCFW